MKAGLARLARQPGMRDEFLLCLYEKFQWTFHWHCHCIGIALLGSSQEQIPWVRG